MTIDQWYDKIKACVPKWFFEDEIVQKAVLYGWARIFYEIEANIQDHVDQTFLTKAVEDLLLEHGAERSVDKISGELESQYRIRIRNISNKSNIIDIKSIVDQLLMIGECILIEDYNNNLFMDREAFMNRGNVLAETIKNTFSIVIDKQLHAPYAYSDREYFLNREDFMSTTESSLNIFTLVADAVNRAKAFGTLYRLIERTN